MSKLRISDELYMVRIAEDELRIVQEEIRDRRERANR